MKKVNPIFLIISLILIIGGEAVIILFYQIGTDLKGFYFGIIGILIVNVGVLILYILQKSRNKKTNTESK